MKTDSPELRLNNEARKHIFTNWILMSKLCDLFDMPVEYIKEISFQADSRLLEVDSLNILTQYTLLTIEQLTKQP